MITQAGSPADEITGRCTTTSATNFRACAIDVPLAGVVSVRAEVLARNVTTGRLAWRELRGRFTRDEKGIAYLDAPTEDGFVMVGFELPRGGSKVFVRCEPGEERCEWAWQVRTLTVGE